MTDEPTTPGGEPDATPVDRPTRPGSVKTPTQTVADTTKVPLEERTWQREGTDAPDAADIEDPKTQL